MGFPVSYLDIDPVTDMALGGHIGDLRRTGTDCTEQ